MPSPDSLASPDGPTQTQGAAPAADGAPRKGNAHLVFFGIFLSRIAGIVRARIMSRYLSQGLESDAFNAALKIPNFMQNLLGEGTLSASFIPVYSTLLKEGREEEAGKVAGTLFAVLVALAGIFSLIGVVAAPLLVSLVATGFHGEKRDLTIACLRIIMPMTSVLVLSAWALGIQNSHRRFFMSYVAPVVWSVAMITTLIAFGGKYDLYHLTVALAWGALAGGILQFLIQVPSVLRLEKKLKVGWDINAEPIREIARNAGPAIAGRGVVQLSSYLDLWLAGFIADAGVTAMSNALLLYMLPISLFGMSVAASELPDLAREGTGSMEQLRERVNSGLRQIYFFVVPSFVAFMILGDIIVAAIFQNGRFDHWDTLQVYFVLMSFSLGLVASTGTRLFSSTFFALRDTKSPARTAMIRVAVSGVLGAALMRPFDHIGVGPELTLGAAGLGLGASIAAWIEWATLRRKLGESVGSVGAGAGVLGRMFGAALVAVLVGRAIAQLTPGMNHILRGAAVLAPVGVIYLGITYAMGLPQARTLLARVTRR
jgi:putative peptidoglycan lipid II flippase